MNDFYRFLLFLKVQDHLDPGTPAGSSVLGSLARFSQLLADFEHVTRRGRYQEQGGKRVFVAGADRGRAFWFGLGNYLLHYAVTACEDFEGETAQSADAVQVMTVHQAKGLEWPVVFLPSLVEGRFPARQAGTQTQWPFSEAAFPQEKRERCAGSDADERRLFFTAITRARDMLYCSCFDRKTREFRPWPYIREIAGTGKIEGRKSLPLIEGPESSTRRDVPPLEISFSQMANWVACGYAYRLSTMFGFQRWLAEELGYGKAVHHVLRTIAEHARTRGDERADRHELQLRIYSHAGRREGFDVRGAYLHSLAESKRQPVEIDEAFIYEAVNRAARALSAIRSGSFPPASSKTACAACDYARLCRYCEKSVRARLEEWEN